MCRIARSPSDGSAGQGHDRDLRPGRTSPGSVAFRFGRAGEGVCRLAVTEAPIDAFSLAAIEGPRADTLHLATGGGIGPGTVSALQHAISAIAGYPGARLVAATDANQAGDRYAERLVEIAAGSGILVERLRPIRTTDWNDMSQGKAD